MKLNEKRLEAPAKAQDDEIDLGQLFRTLWRGKWWISLTTVIAIFIGGYYAYVSAVPLYTASSFVMLESRENQVTDLETVMSGLSGDQASINTEVEVLKSRELAKKLVEKLELVSDPEFNGRLRPEEKYSVGMTVAAVNEIILGEQPATPEPSEAAILDKVISSYLAAISVSNVRQSYVFQITATTTNRKKSALIANTLADLYILNQLDVKFEATEQATTWLTDRVAELQIKLEADEAAVKTFNTGADLVSLEALEGLNRQVKDIRERLNGAEAAGVNFAQRVEDLENAKATGDQSTMAEVAGDRTLQRTFDLVEKGNLKPEVFDTQFQQTLTRAALEAARAQTQVNGLQKSMTDIEAQIARQSQDLVQLQQLQREAEASRLIYEYFLGRLKETAVQQGIQQADSRILSLAVVPSNPSAPRKPMILALSAILGLFFGAGIILLREMRNNSFRSAEDLEAVTGYTVMGQIPNIPARKRKGVLDYLISKPASASAEAVRNLRTSVLLSNVDNPPKVIMSTSSIPGEGKTTQSLALTQNFSGLGKRVLLIEGDIRRRVFTEYFQLPDERGILSVISGEATLAEVVQRHDGLGADILAGEKATTNAADIFASDSFAKLMAEVRDAYDVVIIDTPPVLVVPDARVIAQSVDAILYSVKWDSTSRSQVNEGLRLFESVNVKVSGLVLSQIDPAGMKSYGYGGQYGAYAKYGKNYYHD